MNGSKTSASKKALHLLGNNAVPIMFVIIMSLINSFKVFREVYLLAGDYPFDSLYTMQHFMNNTFKSLDYQKLSSAAIIMAGFMVIVIGILLIAEDRFGKDLEN